MLSLFLYCTVAAFSLAFWLCIRRFIFKSPLDNIPGPPSQSYITGNLPQVYDVNGWKFHAEMAKKYGRVVKFHGLFGDRMLYVSDTKALYHVTTKEHEIYEATTAFIESNRILLGEGLLSTVGDVHHRQRKMFNLVFSVPHMQRMVPTFHEVSKKLCTAIASQVASSGGSREIDIYHWTTRIGLELIGQAGLGYSFDPLTEKSTNPYTAALMNFGPIVFSLSVLSIFVPFIVKLGPPKFRRWLLDTVGWPKLHRLRNIVDEMDRSSIRILQEKKAALRKGDKAMMDQVGGGRDIMSILLRFNMEASEEDQLPETEVLGQMATLVITGMDTTANAIARFLEVLSKYPEAQEKLRQELQQAHDDHGDLTYNELTSLPYLDAIVRETLRLYAPVTMFARTARQDMVLPLSKPIIGVDGSKISEIPIPADTNVVCAMRAVNTDPELWGSDVMEWKPERWAAPLPASLIDANVPGVYSNMMTFLGGPRGCVGYKFSQMEIKCVLFHLLRSFRFSLSDKKYNWNMGVVAFPTIDGQGTLPMRVELLNSQA